jgi:type IV fimbrial biogenesis protein FimT
MKRSSIKNGFTLVELMVAVALVAVLATLAANGLSSMTPKLRLNSALNDLRGNIQKAKLIAVKRNTSCLVVFNTTSPGSYRACLDSDRDYTCDAGEEVILQQAFTDYTNISLQSASFTNGAKVRFNSRGLPENSSGGFAAGSANCTNTEGDSKQVFLSRTGRIRIQ